MRAALGSALNELDETIRARWHIHRRFIYKGDTSTHAQGTDSRLALGAYGELP